MNPYKKLLEEEFSAFDDLYKKYQPIVYSLQNKYFLKDFDQEDWLQEGRIIFYRSLEKYDSAHAVSIGKFFKQNFENHIRSLLRKQCAIKRTIDVTAVSLEQNIENQGEVYGEYLDNLQLDPLEQLVICEKLEELPTRLSEFERVTLQEYLSGKELEEIADEQAVKATTVRSAYDRAKKKIRKIMYD